MHNQFKNMYCENCTSNVLGVKTKVYFRGCARRTDLVERIRDGGCSDRISDAERASLAAGGITVNLIYEVRKNFSVS